jgi:hypothetical protein
MISDRLPLQWRKTWNLGAEGDFDPEWTIWKAQPHNKHTWAFIHYLRRRGDKVIARSDFLFIDIAIKRCE